MRAVVGMWCRDVARDPVAAQIRPAVMPIADLARQMATAMVRVATLNSEA